MLKYEEIVNNWQIRHQAENELKLRYQDPSTLDNYIFAWKYENAFKEIYNGEYEFYDNSHDYLLTVNDPIISKDNPDFKRKDGKTLELKIWKSWFHHKKNIDEYHDADCVLVYSVEDRAFIVYNKFDNYKNGQIITDFNMSDKLKKYKERIIEIIWETRKNI